MVWEGVHVVDHLDRLVCCCVAADAALKGDGLAGDAALEGAQDELLRGGRVEDVETGPVYLV